jgi:putative tricarboxylic transport membrane protein
VNVVKKHNRIAGLFLLLVGIATAVHSWLNLGLGDLSMPGSGLQPFVASLVLVIASALWVLENLSTDPNPQPFWEGRAWAKPLAAFVLMLAYALLMDALGYALATLLFMGIWQFGIEREKWLKSTIVAVITTAVMWFLFSNLLAVPLPGGMFAA